MPCNWRGCGVECRADRLMRTHQTLDYVKRMETKYKSFDHAELEIWQAFQALETYVDSSDPDAEFPNIEHAFQTAEGIRAAGHPDWFQVRNGGFRLIFLANICGCT